MAARTPAALIENRAKPVPGCFQRRPERILRRHLWSRHTSRTLRHGSVERASIEEAIAFIQAYREEPSPQPFVRYEVEVLYNNENKINGQLQDKDSAVQFLRDYAPPAPRTGL